MMRDRDRREWNENRLLPQWKSNPKMKFMCSSTRTLTAMEIIELVEEGILSTQQAETHFDKLKKRNIGTHRESTQKIQGDHGANTEDKKIEGQEHTNAPAPSTEDAEIQSHQQANQMLLKEEKDKNKVENSPTSETPNKTPDKGEDRPAQEKNDSAETDTETQHKPRADTSPRRNECQEYVPDVTQPTHDQGEVPTTAPLRTCNPTPAPQESLPCHPVQHGQLNGPQQPYVSPEVSSDRPHLGQQHPTQELLPQTSPQATPAPPMGTTESKTETQTAITVNNLQQDLKCHSELLRNHTTMNQVDGSSPYKMSSIGFHTETVVTILMVLAVIALAG